MPKISTKKMFSFGIVAVLVVVLSSVLYFSGVGGYLKTSVLDLPEHKSFDGTVYPVKNVPDWVHLDAGKWDSSYNALSESDLTPIPSYDPSALARSVDSLKWGNASDDAIRNAKITYSVPYMGTYKLDGKENTGSHPAVDIKIPSGTPVYTIANGVVVKAVEQSSGFGYHIVVRHNNVPSLNNKNAKEVLYSSYSHLSAVFVEVGDVLNKGEQIALSGSTGTSTTPHLHFQIDNDLAPWHPYWPFTWQEVRDAGLNFHSAVNAGLGQNKAKETTIHPLNYVQKYLDSGFDASDVVDAAVAGSYIPSNEVVIDESEVVEFEEVLEELPEEVVEIVEEVVEEIVEPEVLPEPIVEEADRELTFNFDLAPVYARGTDYSFQINLVDQFGERFRDGFSGDLVVSSDNGKVRVNSAILRNRDFGTAGVFENSLLSRYEGRDRLKIEYDGNTYYSDWFRVDASADVAGFSDVPAGHEYFNAITYLVEEEVVAGYPDGTFKPDVTVSRVEALKFILAGVGSDLSTGSLPFSDVAATEWYGSYLYTAYARGVVDGYPDGTFKPGYTVNKAEFYKLLFAGMGIDVNPNLVSTSFRDVSVDDWFAPFVEKAKELGIIDLSVLELNADQGMSRGEVAYAIYKVMQLAD